MIIVQDKLVSDDIVEKHFVCNLKACKGACCWEGDYGAPLETSELPILRDLYERVKPFLLPDGIAAIEAQGTAVWHEPSKEYVTPLVNNGACAYMTYTETGIAQCGIEQAWKAGEVGFQKPISCHLYPIRVERSEAIGFEALNYDQWHICSPACALGEREQVPVYAFVKDALIRKYGIDFYEELDGAAAFVRGE